MTRCRYRGVWLLIAGLACIAAAGDGQAVQPGDARVDRNGDPLPAGAVLRLGTLRLRHGDTVTLVALPNDKTVLTGSADHTLRLWDRATGKELRRFPVPTVQRIGGRGGAVPLGVQPSVLAALMQDGKTLAIAATNTIHLWDVDTGKEIREIKGPANGFLSGLCFAPDGKTLALRASDMSIHLIATDTGEEMRTLRKQDPKGQARVVIFGRRAGDASRGLAFSSDGKRLASFETELDPQNGMVTSFVRITDVATGKELYRFDTVRTPSTALAYAPNGKTLAVTNGPSVDLHDAADGQFIRKAAVPGAGVILFTPDSKTLIVKAADDRIHVIDAETGQVLRRFGGGQNRRLRGPVLVRFSGGDSVGVALSADGKTVATGDGNTVRLWDVATGNEVPLASGHRGPISSVHIATHGKTAITHGSDGVIRRWDLSDGRELGTIKEPGGTQTMAVAPDGQTIALGSADGSIHVLDAATGKRVGQFRGQGNGVGMLVYAPDGKSVAAVGPMLDRIVVHDVATGAVRGRIVVNEQQGIAGGAIVVRTGRAVGGHASVIFSPDGKTLILHTPAGGNNAIMRGAGAVAASTTMRLFDVATGKELRKIVLPSQRGSGSVALSPDGRVLASENPDHTVSLWELASGHERGLAGNAQVAKAANVAMETFVVVNGGIRLPQAMETASTVAFSPDGRLIAFKDAGKAIRVWDVAAAREMTVLTGHEGAITSLAFTPNSRYLASGSNDTTVLLWDLARVRTATTPTAVKLDGQEVLALWTDLGGDDAKKAFAAIQRLARGSQDAVPLLRDRIKPAAAPDRKKVERLIAQLDSEDFEERNGASEELARIGALAVPALQKVVAGQPTLEARRRVEALLLRLTTGALTPEQVRVVRAIEALERAGTPEARQLLAALANGAPGALMTKQADAALGRLR